MLTAAERLRRSNLFQRTYSAKKSVSTSLFTLYVLPRQPRSTAKLPLAGFVVAKKVHNKAAVRNRVKRRVREAYRLLRQQLQGTIQEKTASEKPGNLGQWYALVWLIHDKAITASWQEIYDSVADCIQRANEKYGRRTAEKSN
jgi:ribonuclease P protein component